MRYIKVPADITLIPSPETQMAPETVTFRRFAFSLWLDDTRAIEGGFAKQVRWAHVIDLFASAAPGQAIALEDEDYAVLRPIVDRPTRHMAPTAAVQLLGFCRAVLDAAASPPDHASAE